MRGQLNKYCGNNMENLEKSALANNSIVKLFTNDKLSRTFSTNEEAISYIKNLSFKTNGIYDHEGNTITVTTPKDNVHKLELI